MNWKTAVKQSWMGEIVRWIQDGVRDFSCANDGRNTDTAVSYICSICLE